MDGIRAYWDGQRLSSRKGLVIQVPPNFTLGFPSIPLDGELWLGRGTLEKMFAIQNATDGDWSEVKYVLFDLPSSKDPFEIRMDQLKRLNLPSHVSIVEVVRCEGIQHLKRHLHHVVSSGGEGLMALQPQSLYSVGRTSHLLKVKVYLLFHP